MSISNEEVKGYILLCAYGVSWVFDITFLQFFFLYFSAFNVIFAELPIDQSEKHPEDKDKYYFAYLSNWWLLRMASIFLLCDLIEGEQVIFGFELFFSILLSFGIVALTGLIFYYKTKIEKTEV